MYTVIRYLEDKPKDNFLILRLDVDRSPKNALWMANLEIKNGIKSTYYFRVERNLNLKYPKEICLLGHEVGYHYEVLSKANGDRKLAFMFFDKELSLLRSACEVNTISRHGRPLSRFDNEDLWNNSSFETYKILGDAGISITGIEYYTDAGRSWDGANSLRDISKTKNNLGIAHNSYDIIRILKKKVREGIYLNIHPERWVINSAEYCLSYSVDFCFNLGKRAYNSYLK